MLENEMHTQRHCIRHRANELCPLRQADCTLVMNDVARGEAMDIKGNIQNDSPQTPVPARSLHPAGLGVEVV